MNYKFFTQKKTPQSQPIPGREAEMIQGRSGGWMFDAGIWKMLRRCLLIGTAHIGLDGQWLLVNQNLCDILGYTPEELNLLTFKQIIHPDKGNLDWKSVVRILASESQTYCVETRYLRRDNTHIWINLNFSVVHSSSGELEYFICVFQDITASKREQAALLESEEQRRLVLDLTNTGLWDWDLTTGEITWNVNHYRLLGLIPNSVQPSYQIWRDRVDPQDIDQVEQAINYALANQTKYEIDYRVVHPDGSNHWVMVRGRGLYDESGQAVRMIGMVFDISERKLAQEKIYEQAALIDVATDAIFVHDLENCILFWSRGAERLYGWTAQESFGKKADEIFSRESLSQLKVGLETTIGQGSWQGELEQVTKTGREIIVESRWALVRDEVGQPKAILVVSTDITQKKQLEAQFLRVQRLESVGILASGIAHDLNNIFTPIITVAQLLPRKFPNTDERTNQMLRILNSSASRGADLVQQILSFGRGNEGRKMSLQIGHLVLEVAKIALETFPKEILIHSDVSTRDLWTVVGDATQLHQVFMNLCVNARDAMPNGGTLNLVASNCVIDSTYTQMDLEAQVGDYVVVTISDTGTGIPKEILERIFDPFFTTKELGKGTGLGLSTVRGIVKNHGGWVNVYSEVVKGTAFKVYLPAQTDQLKIESTEAKQLHMGQGELVLVVDDEKLIQQSMKSTLSEYNYKTLIAFDGIDAIALYAQHGDEIDVVLMDMMMPTMDGLTAIRTLKQLNPAVKIIATSGLISNLQYMETPQTKVAAFLPKPYTVHELLIILHQVLHEH
ncbi:PAS domain S-box protein [Aetokthonos hydrillicola Thurmond2011]|jgi:PAS domain S-box-containing protein|uniref:histidine kinase n=1 Tax=Aetokthonos hydrillicola Thurmond2011 TaxID=2712845 RepID=A0AAP5I8R5_9CYAN|nr:PAS domain S-box protein [Aetokthonos hydrillicola]MBO3461382.1 PAS domain S-box protein [Aetokthonos hydrillicola CCALA 1050]MBW4586818.1 PAS domain S-box protein [Aetokthonos hydrillicola CCALA 1050]MDR9895824.1 PAS domain S-box protein [Aetokthonos hydrillicola Thurmond2011]